MMAPGFLPTATGSPMGLSVLRSNTSTMLLLPLLANPRSNSGTKGDAVAANGERIRKRFRGELRRVLGWQANIFL